MAVDRKALFDEHQVLAGKIFTEGLSAEEEQRLAEVRSELDKIMRAELAQGSCMLAKEVQKDMGSILTEGSPEYRACKAAGKIRAETVE